MKSSPPAKLIRSPTLEEKLPVCLPKCPRATHIIPTMNKRNCTQVCKHAGTYGYLVQVHLNVYKGAGTGTGTSTGTFTGTGKGTGKGTGIGACTGTLTDTTGKGIG